MFRTCSSLLVLAAVAVSGCSSTDGGRLPPNEPSVGGATSQTTFPENGGFTALGSAVGGAAALTGGVQALSSNTTGGLGTGGFQTSTATSSTGEGKTGGAPGVGGSLSTGGTSGAGYAKTGGTATIGGAHTGGTSSATGGGSWTGGARSGGAPTTGGALTGGVSATGGAQAGGVSSSGGARTGGASATGGTSSATGLSCSSTLPAYTSSTTVSSTITISGTKDYSMQRFCADPTALGDGDQGENQKPVFMLSKGAVLRNVIIGGSGCSAADGIHCESGSCTLENVWIGNVGEDAITFKGSDSSQVMTITGGGAFDASDKVIQHNGPGTIKINGFFVKTAGKLYRSCGNCSKQYARHVEMSNIFASGISSVLAGVNANYGDTATINSVTKCGSVSTICETFTGNDSGDEPTALNKYTTSGDGKYCIFTSSNIK